MMSQISDKDSLTNFFEDQVGGHPQFFLISKDSSRLFKYVLPESEEPSNYQLLLTKCPAFSRYLPLTFGTIVAEQKPYFVMENLVRNYRYPCIMDLKIGKTATFPHASEEKIKRTELKISRCTVHSLGIRLIGAKTYDPSSDCWTRFTKNYGLTLSTRNNLKETFRSFFSVHDSVPEESETTNLVTFDKWDDEALLRYEHNGILRSHVLERVLHKLREFELFLKGGITDQFRFYCSSILIAYDGMTPEPVPADTDLDVTVKLVDLQHLLEITDADPVSKVDNGFLAGVDTLISILDELHCDGQTKHDLGTLPNKESE